MPQSTRIGVMFLRLLFSTISIALAASAFAFYVRDSKERAPAETFVRRFHAEFKDQAE